MSFCCCYSNWGKKENALELDNFLIIDCCILRFKILDKLMMDKLDWIYWWTHGCNLISSATKKNQRWDFLYFYLKLNYLVLSKNTRFLWSFNFYLIYLFFLNYNILTLHITSNRGVWENLWQVAGKVEQNKEDLGKKPRKLLAFLICTYSSITDDLHFTYCLWRSFTSD